MATEINKWWAIALVLCGITYTPENWKEN